MATRDETPFSPRNPGGPVPRAIEDLFAEYAERLTAGERLDPEAILREHPELGEDLLDQLESFLDLGADSTPPCPLGSLGDYELLRQVGRGGMGVVYEAWENSMDRRVALKVLPAALAADSTTFTRFFREARLAGRLHHPNIVPVFGMGIKDDAPHYSMEFVEGETLAQIVAKLKDAEPESDTVFGKKDRPGYFERLAECFANVADGLQYAHSRGVIHRDIKPSNLILDSEAEGGEHPPTDRGKREEGNTRCRLRILDFGLARLEGQESITIPGNLLGTPRYMSPEQARRRKIPVDHRTDIYSLGATLYEMITCRPPFMGKDQLDTLSQILERDAVRPSRINPRVPQDLETIVLKCLSKEPEDRYGTAEALGQDLRRFVRGDPVEARPQSALERLARKILRERWKILRRAAVVALLAGCALLGALSWRQVQTARNDRYDSEVLQQKMILLRNQTILETASGAKNLDREALILSLAADSTLLAQSSSPAERAVEKLSALAAELPRRFEAHYYLARGLLLLGRRDDARTALDLALERNPLFLPARILREEIVDREAAPARIRAWLDREKDASWQALWFAAHVAERERDWTSAGQAYTQLIDLARETEGEFYLGSRTDLYLRRANVRIEAGSLSKAQQDLSFIHLNWPGLFEPVLLLAKTYYLDENTQEARDVLEDLYRTADSTNEVATWCAVFCTSMGDCEQAIRWADRIEESSPEQMVINGRIKALAFFRLGRTVEAYRILEEMIQLDPQDSMALHMKAQFIYLEKAYSRPRSQATEALDEVIRLGEEVTRLHGDYAPAHSLLALAYQERGEPEKALASYRKALEIQPINLMVLEPLSLMLYWLAEVDELRSFHRKARESMVDLSPREEAFFAGWNGFFLRIDGRWDDAVAAYTEAARLDPRLHWPLRNIARIRFEQGEYDQAAEYAREAIARAPSLIYWENGSKILATTLQRQDILDEAVRVCCQSIAVDPRDKAAHEAFLALQFRYRESPLLDGLEQLLDVLEGLPEEGQRDDWIVLRTVAFLRVHVPSRRDVSRARDAISRVLETRRNDSFAVFVLAMVQHEAGDLREAILTLERAVRGWRPYTFHSELLNEYREEVFPGLVSFDSVDAALASLPRETEDRDLVDGVERATITASEPARCVTYLEGRLLQRGGNPSAAAEKFFSLINHDASEVMPHLRLAECIRDDGWTQEAEAYLRQILDKRVSGGGALWKLWLRLCLDDLDLEPRQVLARLPLGVEGYSEHVRWLLEQLDGDGAIRINCGGREYRDQAGAVWGPDRFAHGGEKHFDMSRAIRDTTDEPLHRTTRGFFRDELASGYRVPLPSGSYRVAIHMVDERVEAGADNRVEVVVEGTGKLVLQGYAFNRWCLPAVHRCHVFDDVHVEDGALDLEFRQEVQWPQVSAIEIVPLAR